MIDPTKPGADYVPTVAEIRGWLGAWKNPNGFVQAEGFDRWIAGQDALIDETKDEAYQNGYNDGYEAGRDSAERGI